MTKGSAAARKQFEESLRQQGAGSAPSPQQERGMILHAPPAGGGASLDEMLAREDQARTPGVAAKPPLASSAPLLSAPGTESPPAGKPAAVAGVQRVALDSLVDSPFQPRLGYDETAVQELAGALEQAGQLEPIKVRPLGEKFELIQGHRRSRAARLLGWTHLDAWVEVLSDVEAEKAALVGNEGRKDLTEFERALAFQRALDRGFASNQRGLAHLFGCSQGRVSQAMQMLQLPKEITALLRTYPGLFGYRTAKAILDMRAKYPDHGAEIFDCVRQLIEHDETDPATLIAWVERAVRGEPQRALTRAEPLQVLAATGEVAYRTRVKGNQIVVEIKAGANPEEVQQWILDALRGQVSESSMKKMN